MEMPELVELMKQRHSVRQYTDAPIEPDKRECLTALAERINAENGLHIQLLFEEPRCFQGMMARYGHFSGVQNYIALVGPKSPETEEALGYYGEQLVLKAQELGLNTCWVALTHGRSKAEVRKGEKEICLISLGYGVTQGVMHKSKALQEVCTAGENTPDWFLLGMECALLAPTATNQQKFFFTLAPDESVSATCGKGFYTRLDLGIVKYHFEAVTQRKVRT